MKYIRYPLEKKFTNSLLSKDDHSAFTVAVDDLLHYVIRNYIKKNKENKEIVQKVWPSLLSSGLQPDDFSKCTFEIVSFPLSRVGAEEGASGSKVLVTFFKLLYQGKVISSEGLILKYYLKDKDKKINKLEEERDNAKDIREHSFPTEDFAMPFRYSKQGRYSFLWSPFTSSTQPVPDSGCLEPEMFKEDNLAKRILLAFAEKERKCEREKDVEEIIKLIYDRNLDVWHSNNRAPSTKKFAYLEEYNWYLRESNDWSFSQLENIWGPSTRKATTDFCESWINPLWVYDRVKDMRITSNIGAIHGDLHPKNIVISHADQARIIDLGWTQCGKHIVKDFALMEANIRFLTLHNNYSYKELKKLAKSIDDDSLKKKLDDPVYRWIYLVRDKLKRHLGEYHCNHTKEYVIPLFLISLGLLRYMGKSISNQISARLTVLGLAKYIYEREVKNGK